MKNKVLKILFIICLIIGCLVILTACGENKKTKSEKKGFSVKFQGIEISPGTEFDEDVIPENYEISEIPSCAFEGVDKIYTYPELEITVADINGKPTVYSVYFISENASTGEGVKISDSKDLMVEKYGENFENSLENKYDYKKDDVELSFIIENDIIVGIEYTLITK